MSLSKATAAAVLLSIAATHAFVPPSPFSSRYVTQRLSQSTPLASRTSPYPNKKNNNVRSWDLLQMTATASNEDLKEEISAMRVKEIRQELESYGISTKS
eukprot:93263_1